VQRRPEAGSRCPPGQHLGTGLGDKYEASQGRSESLKEQVGTSFGTPSGPAAWHALPSWYAVSAHDRAIDPALQRFMAQRAGSTTVEFAAASHVGGLTHYKARFVKLIEQAIKATAN
jgi:hypothetical protein